MGVGTKIIGTAAVAATAIAATVVICKNAKKSDKKVEDNTAAPAAPTSPTGE